MSSPPFTVDASRTPPAAEQASTIEHQSQDPKNSRFDSASWWSVRLTLCGGFLSLFSYLSSMEVLDDCNAVAHTPGSPERVAQHADDKHSQSVFIVLFHVIFLFLALGSIADFRTSKKSSNSLVTHGKICLFWFVDAAVAYGWRVALYLYVVRPLGLAAESRNCGTSKSISGHTHFYCFHLLQLLYLVWSNSVPPFLSSRPKKPTTMGDSSDPQFFSSILRWGLQLYALVVVFWTLVTLERTYALGFHSLRHMIAGFAAALFTIGLYVSNVLFLFLFLYLFLHPMLATAKLSFMRVRLVNTPSLHSQPAHCSQKTFLSLHFFLCLFHKKKQI
jgi:hypothetical protein